MVKLSISWSFCLETKQTNIRQTKKVSFSNIANKASSTYDDFVIVKIQF